MRSERPRGHVPGDWRDRPIEATRWKRELQHLKRRARSRTLLVFLLAGLASALTTAYAARRQPLRESEIIIRVTEGRLVREESPLAQRDLRSYVMDSAFSNDHLLPLIDRLDLYPLQRARSDLIAADELRDHIEIAVYRNYFLRGAEGMSSERSVRIAITFGDRDPELSMKVCQALAQLVIDSENERRAAYSAEDVGIAERLVADGEQLMKDRAEEMTAAEVELARATKAGDVASIATQRVTIDTLKSQMEAQAIPLAKARAKLDHLHLLMSTNSADLGLHFAIAEERAPLPVTGGFERLVAIALASFLILLPLCGVAIGAFDPRVHDREDLQRLGLTLVGHVPRFEGFQVGGLDDRQERARLVGRRSNV